MFTVALFPMASYGVSIFSVMAILGCHLDYTCNELKHTYKIQVYTCEGFLINLKWKNLLLIWIF